MAIRIKTQRDYLLTEVSMELPCDLSDLDLVMRTQRATGKIVAQYSEGGLLGINVEQRTKVREGISDKVREIIGVGTKEFNGDHEGSE
jgi:hypothetical protein